MAPTETPPAAAAAEMPSAPPEDLPSVILQGSEVIDDLIVLRLQMKGRLTDPRATIARLLADELETWKQTSAEWQRYQPFGQRLEEAARDLREAETAAAAAKAAWQEAVRTAGDAAAHERNVIEAETRVKVVQERQAALRQFEKERKLEVEGAWRTRVQQILNERRRRCEVVAQSAREAFVRSANGLAVVGLFDETRLLVTLALGANGLFGLSPRLF